MHLDGPCCRASLLPDGGRALGPAARAGSSGGAGLQAALVQFGTNTELTMIFVGGNGCRRRARGVLVAAGGER